MIRRRSRKYGRDPESPDFYRIGGDMEQVKYGTLR